MRQLPQLGLRHSSYLRDASLDAGTWLEEYFYNRDSIERLRFDVLNVIDRGRERALGHRHDAVAHILRIQPVVTPDDADHWNVNVWKNVGRGANDRKRPQQYDQNCQHHERIRPP